MPKASQPSFADLVEAGGKADRATKGALGDLPPLPAPTLPEPNLASAPSPHQGITAATVATDPPPALYAAPVNAEDTSPAFANKQYPLRNPPKRLRRVRHVQRMTPGAPLRMTIINGD
jgi:hypothetical protein